MAGPTIPEPRDPKHDDDPNVPDPRVGHDESMRIAREAEKKAEAARKAAEEKAKKDKGKDDKGDGKKKK